MAEPTNELILEILRRIQTDIADLKADVREIRARVGNLEIHIARMEVRLAELSVRMGRRDEPMERILRRLELTEHPH
jgi:septal ring factor EnvC (AmiA/AmiB activator)